MCAQLHILVNRALSLDHNVEIAELFSIRLDVIQKWMETQLLEPIIHMPYSYLSKFPLDRITEKYCDFSF